MDRATLTNPKTPAQTRACENCVHFQPSVKEAAGRGLCVLYSLVLSKRDGCRYGFEPKPEPRVQPAR
jgi:hypothetical protein